MPDDPDDGRELLDPEAENPRRGCLGLLLLPALLTLTAAAQPERPREIAPMPREVRVEVAPMPRLLSDPSPAPSPGPRPTPPAGRPAPKPAPPPAKEPEKAPKPVVKAGEGVTLTVYSLREVASAGEVKPGKGYKLLTLDVEVWNTAKKKAVRYGPSPKLFRIKGADSREADPVGRRFPGSMTSGELAPGEKVRGLLAFEVKELAGLTVTYSGGSAPLSVKLTK